MLRYNGIKKRHRIVLSSYLFIGILILGSIVVFNSTVDSPKKINASATLVSIDITLDHATVFSEVGPGKSGISVNKGWVRIDKKFMANFQYISVYLEVDAGDWAASIAPA